MTEEESNALSINAEKNKINLEVNASDKTVTLLKGIVGLTPVVGSVLQEVVGVVIPNQRIERIVLMLECFDQKVNHLEEEVLQQKIQAEEFIDLLEDAIPQAARSLSEERRNYIASLLKNSITNDELDHIQEKKLLSILGELNDVEIITLRYNSLDYHEQNKFYEQHHLVLEGVATSITSPTSEHDKNAIQTSFKEKLIELGLLRQVFIKPQSGKIPEMDEKTGRLKAKYNQVTQLGRLLLRYIDQPATADRRHQELLDQRAKIQVEE